MAPGGYSFANPVLPKGLDAFQNLGQLFPCSDEEFVGHFPDI